MFNMFACKWLKHLYIFKTACLMEELTNVAALADVRY